MKKEKVITRTVFVTVCSVVGVNLKDNAIVNEELEVIGVYTASALLDEVKEQYETPNFKIAAITDVRQEQRLYEMTEKDFVRMGKRIELRKNYKKEEEQEEQEDKIVLLS